MIKNFKKISVCMYGLRFNMTVFQLRADDICLDIFKSMLLNKKKHFLLHKLNHKIYNMPVVK